MPPTATTKGGKTKGGKTVEYSSRKVDATSGYSLTLLLMSCDTKGGLFLTFQTSPSGGGKFNTVAPFAFRPVETPSACPSVCWETGNSLRLNKLKSVAVTVNASTFLRKQKCPQAHSKLTSTPPGAAPAGTQWYYSGPSVTHMMNVFDTNSKLQPRRQFCGGDRSG
ncbi:hypothetical protein fugu_010326 [Takifugu bimaculatus]|uniref:Uncharacterized protein n=1 Tax=Takifugu bimaculatus TaxID=433685 RepID=A0A4Z2CF68_9TELE|nr:hypothetical protein fugu_010326 [Takifugu bimaculatus]